jgi:ribosome recycling factor
MILEPSLLPDRGSGKSEGSKNVLDEIKKDAASRMAKSVASLQQDLTKIRTGRAHTSLLDHITVEYYGSQVPLNQVSNVGIEDSRTLIVTPWEKDMVQPIEKAIMTSDLGLNPATAGTVIRVPLPALTEERRKDMIRLVRNEAEGGRIAIRNIRRDAMHDIKELLKEKMIGEDDERRAEGEIQDITDKHVGQVDEILAGKESELMEI